MSLEIIGHTCIGAKHIESGKPCQDYSATEVFGEQNDCYCIAVSDGHGSDKYFRSDRGSRFAVEISINAVKEFVKELPEGTITASFAQSGVQEYASNKEPLEKCFRHLFDSICAQWHDRIMDDWNQNPPTEEEYINADSNKGDAVLKFFSKDNPHLPTAYGCTLIVAVRTPKYWFAFHIGDGKCVAFKEDGSWFEPIPWDERCYENITTSLCHEGSESFRYCYGTDQVQALFIGSDGMDDTYKPMSALANWYRQVLYLFEKYPSEDIQAQLMSTLPKLSENGSHDDMSVRAWVDNNDFVTYCSKLRSFEIKEKDDQVKAMSVELSDYNNRRDGYWQSVNDLETKNQKLRTIIEQETNRCEEIKSNIENLKNEEAQIEAEIRRIEGLLRQKQFEKSEVKKNIVNKEESLKRSVTEIDKRKKELAENDKSLTKNKVNLAQIEKTISRVNGLMEKINDTIEFLKKKQINDNV